jgi:TRAP-type transport system periplasmic protein
MRMTHLLHVVAGASLATMLASTAHAEDKPAELRIATLAPSGSPWMAVLDRASAEIKEKTGGRITLKYYEGGQQGDERDFVRKVQLGQLDGAAVTAVGLSLIDESIKVLELPRLFASIEEVDYVADRMWPYFQKKFEKKGFKLNDRGEVGWVHMMSKSEIKTPADLKAMKPWLWEDKVVKAMFAKLGLRGVPLGVPEVDAALTSNRIDACYGSPVAAVALQWYTKVKYITSMPMTFAIGATVVSLEALKKVSAEDQKTIQDIGRAASKKLRRTIRKGNDDAKATMAKKGLKVSETPPEVVAEFDRVAAEVQKELTGKVFSKEELEMVLKYREEFRAKKK